MSLQYSLLSEIKFEQVAVSGTAANSGACPGQAVNINTPNVDVFYQIGTAPVATTGNGSGYIPAGSNRDILVQQGQIVSLITAGGTGTAYLTHMTQ